MAQHTSGPWTVGREDHAGGVPVITVCNDERTVCETCATFVDRGDVDFQITDEDRANAYLIAAAPDLLSALKALVQVHRDQDTAGVMPADKAIAYGKADAALALAEARA